MAISPLLIAPPSLAALDDGGRSWPEKLAVRWCGRRELNSPTNFHAPELLTDREDARRAQAEAVFARRPRRVWVGFLTGEGSDPVRTGESARAIPGG